ncbi:histidine kinase [Curtobacterium sp. PhB130]|uniref:sensor histidine kinase n=1 Tax=unclassified Curtobacterium TaxID=257496 RepID=UPI000FAFD57B|nr:MULTISPECIES: histidine kinase [unclassified Curtobacterium]ROS77816.1 histidine kinase [Curtobacterium sp. PhB130]TCK65969.1 histidine kinase [Curtobacterium sp. PhB136]
MIFRPLATRSIVVDVAWAVVAALVFVAPVDVELEHASLSAVLLAAAAIALRRLSPSGAMVTTVLLGFVQVTGYERPSLVDIALFVVVGTSAIVGTKAEVVLSGVLALVAGIGATVYLAYTGYRFALIISGPPDQALLAAAAPVTALLAVWAGGLAVRSWTSRNRESERRVEAEAVATRAVDEAESERIRGAIARDVHDVVGHSLAVIIAQADSVPFLQDEARIREVSATIASTARSSLVEVRQVLGHIDGSGDRVDPASLEEIVQGIREAGVQVDHTVRGTPRPLGKDTGTAARRVLQEMLTNALRHGAPGLPVVVRETWRSGDLVLEVENVVRTSGETTSGSGRGVDGMRARLAALDGSFDAAVVDDLFAARARIPLALHDGTPR